jgi:hypothetical protein
MKPIKSLIFSNIRIAAGGVDIVEGIEDTKEGIQHFNVTFSTELAEI